MVCLLSPPTIKTDFYKIDLLESAWNPVGLKWGVQEHVNTKTGTDWEQIPRSRAAARSAAFASSFENNKYTAY